MLNLIQTVSLLNLSKNKNTIESKFNVNSVQILRFLKRKNLIYGLAKNKTNWIIKFNTLANKTLNLSFFLGKNLSYTYSEILKLRLGEKTYTYVYSTPYGLMDQRDLLKYKIGGKLLFFIKLN